MLDDVEFRENTIASVMNANIEGQMLMTIGKSTGDILNGSMEPLGLLFNNGLVDEYYAQLCSEPYNFALCSRWKTSGCSCSQKS